MAIGAADPLEGTKIPEKKQKMILPDLNELREITSALCFARKRLLRIAAGRSLALLNAGLAAGKLRARDQRAAAAAAGCTLCVLAALVSEPVFRGADIWPIRSAGQVKAMTSGQSAGRLPREDWSRCREGGYCTARRYGGTTGNEQACNENDRAG